MTAGVPTGKLARSRRLLGMAARVAGQEARHRWQSAVAGSAELLERAELETRIAQAKVLAQNLAHLKGAAMKAGQLLSMDASDLLPAEATEILARLQGHAEPVDFSALEQILLEDLGSEGLARLQELERSPAASASIGQVHRARVDGRSVAVKIQYPGVAESIDDDLDVLQGLAESMKRVMRRDVELREMFDELRVILHLEADYEREKNNLRTYRERLGGERRFVVPEVFDDLSSRRVLTMSWEEGVPLRDWIASDPGLDARESFARALLDLYCREFFEWGFVQTDPNPGNFLIREGGERIVLLDFGATVTYDQAFRDGYVALLRHMGRRDEAGIVRAGRDFGLLDPREGPEAQRAFVALLVNSVEPFAPERQPFVFRDDDYAAEGRALTRAFVASLRHTPPPRRILFLHRKLGGIFQLLRRLDVCLDLRPYWARMVEPGG